MNLLQEAREISRTAIQSLYDKEIRDAIREIRKAARRGETSCYINGLSDEAQTFFVLSGFVVESGPCEALISW